MPNVATLIIHGDKNMIKFDGIQKEYSGTIIAEHPVLNRGVADNDGYTINIGLKEISIYKSGKNLSRCRVQRNGRIFLYSSGVVRELIAGKLTSRTAGCIGDPDYRWCCNNLPECCIVRFGTKTFRPLKATIYTENVDVIIDSNDYNIHEGMAGYVVFEYVSGVNAYKVNKGHMEHIEYTGQSCFKDFEPNSRIYAVWAGELTPLDNLSRENPDNFDFKVTENNNIYCVEVMVRGKWVKIYLGSKKPLEEIVSNFLSGRGV